MTDSYSNRENIKPAGTETIPKAIETFLARRLWECDKSEENGRPIKGLFYVGLVDALDALLESYRERYAELTWRLAGKTNSPDIAQLTLAEAQPDEAQALLESYRPAKRYSNYFRKLDFLRDEYSTTQENRTFVAEQLIPTLISLSKGIQPTTNHLETITEAKQQIDDLLAWSEVNVHPDTADHAVAFFSKLEAMITRSLSAQGPLR